MSGWLKQSTTVSVRMGPYLDKTDGVSEETAITPVVEVSKGHGAFGARSSATAITHDAEGWFAVELNATDTGTVGKLIVKSHDAATHLPVWHEFMVLPANVYDALVPATDRLQVDTTQVGGDTVAANNLRFAFVGAVSGSVDTGAFTPTTTAFELDTITEATDDHYNGCLAIMTDGTVATQARWITDYDGTNKRLTIAPALTEAPGSGDFVLIIGLAHPYVTALAASAVDAAALATDAVNEIRDAILSDSTAFPGANVDVATSSRLAPTTATRTLDVTAGGAAGIDWGNIESPTGSTPSVNIAQINAAASAAVRLALSAGQMVPATVDTAVAPTTTEFECDDITEATADHYNGRIVIWTSGVLAGQATDITDYALAGGKGHFTVTAMTEAPGNNDTMVIV